MTHETFDATPDDATPDDATPDDATSDDASRGSATGVASLTDAELAWLQQRFEMARHGDPQLADDLAHGLPPNLTNGQGDTLLILATYHRQHAVVEALLRHGADTERVNDRGQTALGCAVFRQDAELVRALLAAGADPDGGGRSARQFADFFDLPEMSRLLDE